MAGVEAHSRSWREAWLKPSVPTGCEADAAAKAMSPSRIVANEQGQRPKCIFTCYAEQCGPLHQIYTIPGKLLGDAHHK
jgi:hypothetical protein